MNANYLCIQYYKNLQKNDYCHKIVRFKKKTTAVER